MGSPKYLDIILNTLKDLTNDVKDIASSVSQQSTEIATIKLEIAKNNEHMAEYNKQLDIHIKNSELAHLRADAHDLKFITIERDIKEVQGELAEKLDLVYNHIVEEKQEKVLRKKIEDESLIKKERLYKTVKIITSVLGIPLALYGFLKLLMDLVSKF